MTEPALPRSAVSATSKRYEPDLGEWLGAKLSSVEPSRSPDTAAPLIAAAALTAERCCGKSPGLRRPARMFDEAKGARRHGRKAQGGPENLAAAFAMRAVEGENIHRFRPPRT